MGKQYCRVYAGSNCNMAVDIFGEGKPYVPEVSHIILNQSEIMQI